MHRFVNFFSEHIHKPPVKFPLSPFHFSSMFHYTPISKNSCAPMSVNWNFCPYPCPKPVNWDFYHQHHLDELPDPHTAAEDRSSCKEVKLFCSFGGKMVPSEDDGKLRYVSGQNRMVAVPRDTTFGDFYYKMNNLCGSPPLICYQIPHQNLDTLVSIFTDEDLEYMMDEFDSLSKDANHGSTNLRIFLFPLSNHEQHSAGLKNTASNVSGSEALTFDGNSSKRHSNDNIKSAPTTLNSNVRGKTFINDALENPNFQISSDFVGTKNVAPLIEDGIERHHLQQQQQGDSSSLFSDQDPWEFFGFQLSPSDPDDHSKWLRNTTSNVRCNEALTSTANTRKRLPKDNIKHTTVDSNIRGNDNISALKDQYFQMCSNVIGTRNVATQNEEDIERRHLNQQQHGDLSSLFSGQDPWTTLGYQLSNILGDQTHNN